MNRSSLFIDGACGPWHAKHVSHRPGTNRGLKAEAAASVRRAYKHEITAQLKEIDEEVVLQRHTELYDAREDECIETFASVVQLIFRLLGIPFTQLAPRGCGRC